MTSTTPASRPGRAGIVLAGLVALALVAWLVAEATPHWRRYYALWTAPAPLHLPVPVEGIEPRRIANTWGAERDAGARKHEGLDIFASRGTPVICPVDGVVLGTGQDRLGGNVVRVLGPGHQVHYFAHLDAFGEIHRGDWVRPGAVLGYVGTTGNARGTPPHLHYGIYDAGGAINPYPLLAPRDATATHVAHGHS